MRFDKDKQGLQDKNINNFSFIRIIKLNVGNFFASFLESLYFK